MKKLSFIPIIIGILVSCSKYLSDSNGLGNNEELTEGITKNVVTTSGGELAKILGEDLYNISSLTIDGPINSTDVALIRRMAGCDEYLNHTDGILTHLSMKNAEIERGGYPYILLEDEELVTVDNEISDYMFYECNNLEYVSLPNNITKIGYAAFYNCVSLRKVDIPEQLQSLSAFAFYGCENMDCIITLPNIKSINKATFYKCGKLQHIYPSDDLESIGDHAFTYCSNLMALGSLDNLISFGEYAFAECVNLRYFNVPSSMRSIPEGSFYKCKMLTSIDLSNITDIDDYAFTGCRKLSNILFSDSVRYIGLYAFQATAIEGELSLPETVEFIGAGAFSYIDGITSVNIRSDIKTTDDDVTSKAVFFDCNGLERLRVSEGVTTLGVNFSNCDNLEYIELPSTLESIGYGDGFIVACDYIFSYCTSLKTIEIPSNLKYIAAGTFSNCTSLNSVVIPDGVKTINAYTFNKCVSLMQINLPSSLRMIGQGAFQGCCNLTNLEMPDAVENIGHLSFADCTSLETVVMPQYLQSIDQEAFLNCSSLINVNFNPNLVEIKANAFNNCIKLASAVLNDGLIKIGDSAFYHCPNMIELSLPSSLSDIGDYAFGFTGLTDVKLNWISPIEMPNNIFDGVNLSNAILYVPTGSAVAYEDIAPWNLFGCISEM